MSTSKREYRQQSLSPGYVFTEVYSSIRFFIRCKREPTIYWHVDGKGRIEASQTHRTKFRISIEDSNANETTIMIGDDTVSVEVASKEGGSNANGDAICECSCGSCACNSSSSGKVGKNAIDELVVSNTSLTFKFEAFKNGFEIESIVNRDDSTSSTAILKVDDGEAWELV